MLTLGVIVMSHKNLVLLLHFNDVTVFHDVMMFSVTSLFCVHTYEFRYITFPNSVIVKMRSNFMIKRHSNEIMTSWFP